MQKDLISIISPVYKTEKYLKQCIDSVLRQTYSNWELIMVSDASPDRSVEIIKTYQKKDPRIKLHVNSENMGLSHTRFEGLKIAQGEFIMHLDSDDWLHRNALKVMHEKMIQESADLVTGAITRVIDKFGLINIKMKNNYSLTHLTKAIELPELFEEYYISYFGSNKLLVNMCGKLYRKSVIDQANLSPTAMTMGEDLLYNMNLHPKLNKIAFVSDNVYYYRYGGLTNSSNPTFLEDIKCQYFIKKQNIDKYNYTKAIPFFKYELINCFYSHFENLVLLDRIPYNNLKKMIQKEINDPIYNDATVGTWADNKTQMIKKKDIDGIILIVEKQVNAHRSSHTIKTLLNKVFKLLS